MPRGRSLFATDIRPHYICGGRGGRWPRVVRYCLGFFCLIRAMNTAQRSSKQKGRELLPKVQGQIGAKDEDLRKSLLKFIGDFANWDLSSDRTFLEVSRGLVKAAHPEETPLVVDPFAGGGSIPLEALRLGCEAFASDLNPVACLILKVMLEDIPRQGPEVADELRCVGAEIKSGQRRSWLSFTLRIPMVRRPLLISGREPFVVSRRIVEQTFL